MSKFNYTALQQELVEATRRAFNEVRESHRGESFYVFALFTTPDCSYVLPTAYSEEALAAKGESARWDPYDWKSHSEGEQHFDRVQKLLDDNPATNIADDAAAEKHIERLLETFIKALKQLDAEGFFGVGSDREKVVVLIRLDDEDTNLLLECAEQLNPPSVFERFAKPFQRNLIGQFTEIGSRKIYEKTGVGVSADGSVITAVSNYFLFAFETESFSEILKKRTTDASSSLALSPNGSLAAVGWRSESGPNGGIALWSIPKKKKLSTQIPEFNGGVSTVKFSPDGRILASGGQDGMIRFWEPTSGELLRELVGHEEWIQCVDFSPDGRWLASVASTPNSLRIWEVTTGKEIASFEDCGLTLAFSPDGTLLAVGSGYTEHANESGEFDELRDVRLWDFAGRRLFRRIEGLPQAAQVVCFSRDGRYLATGTSFPGTAQLWDLKSGQQLLSLDPDYEFISDMAFLHDGRTIAVTGRAFSRLPLLLWDISDATLVGQNAVTPAGVR